MKKFEIINDCWIKKLDLNEGRLLEVVKISAITSLKSNTVNYSNHNYIIELLGVGVLGFFFLYGEAEEKQYKSDLAFLEKLLF